MIKWLIVVKCGKNVGDFCKNVEKCGKRWEVVVNVVVMWGIVDKCGVMWEIMGECGVIWYKYGILLMNAVRLWKMLGHSFIE